MTCRTGWPKARAITTRLLARMESLQHELEACGAWTYEAQAEKVIDRFGLDPDASVGTLSGGQKKRLALAQALAVAPEVLLLDEPTNHLDIAAIEWLENMLIETGVTLFFITHDRSFLNRVCTRIVELDRGKLVSFPGSYGQYQQRKEQLLHEEGLANARADKLLKEEEVWIRKGVEARRTRAVFRVQRLDKLRAERQARRERMGKVNLQLDAGDKSGKLVAELEHVSKSFGQRPIVRDFSAPHSARRQDRRDRPQRRRQDDAAAADPRRIEAGRRHRAPGYQDRCRLFRPVPHPAQSGFQPCRRDFARVRITSRSAARRSM